MRSPRRSSQIMNNKPRCTMLVNNGTPDGARCQNAAVYGDTICEPCMARVERLLNSEEFRRVLEWSVRSSHAKNGKPKPS